MIITIARDNPADLLAALEERCPCTLIRSWYHAGCYFAQFIVGA